MGVRAMYRGEKNSPQDQSCVSYNGIFIIIVNVSISSFLELNFIDAGILAVTTSETVFRTFDGIGTLDV